MHKQPLPTGRRSPGKGGPHSDPPPLQAATLRTPNGESPPASSPERPGGTGHAGYSRPPPHERCGDWPPPYPRRPRRNPSPGSVQFHRLLFRRWWKPSSIPGSASGRGVPGGSATDTNWHPPRGRAPAGAGQDPGGDASGAAGHTTARMPEAPGRSWNRLDESSSAFPSIRPTDRPRPHTAAGASSSPPSAAVSDSAAASGSEAGSASATGSASTSVASADVVASDPGRSLPAILGGLLGSRSPPTTRTLLPLRNRAGLQHDPAVGGVGPPSPAVPADPPGRRSPRSSFSLLHSGVGGGDEALDVVPPGPPPAPCSLHPDHLPLVSRRRGPGGW